MIKITKGYTKFSINSFTYVGTEDDFDEKDIVAMVKNASPITRTVFQERVTIPVLRKLFPQYVWGRTKAKVSFISDWKNMCYSSKLRGIKCVFVENQKRYIFMEPNTFKKTKAGFEVVKDE